MVLHQRGSTEVTEQAAVEVFEIEGTLKTTQAGKLVIQVNQYLANQCVAGEVFTLDGKRQFQMVGKGQPFPVVTEREIAAYAKETNNSKTESRRHLMGVYLYVTEITPPVAAAAPIVSPATETCARCGDARGSMCPMSEDGEGEHDIVSMPALTADDVDFLNRLAVHTEQGAMER